MGLNDACIICKEEQISSFLIDCLLIKNKQMAQGKETLYKAKYHVKLNYFLGRFLKAKQLYWYSVSIRLIPTSTRVHRKEILISARAKFSAYSTFKNVKLLSRTFF